MLSLVPAHWAASVGGHPPACGTADVWEAGSSPPVYRRDTEARVGCCPSQQTSPPCPLTPSPGLLAFLYQHPGTTVSQPDPDGSRHTSILGAPSLGGGDRSREMTRGVSSSQPQPLTHTFPSFHPKASQGPWTSIPGPCCQLSVLKGRSGQHTPLGRNIPLSHRMSLSS